MVETRWFEEMVGYLNDYDNEHLIILSRVCKNELRARKLDAWIVFGDHQNGE